MSYAQTNVSQQSFDVIKNDTLYTSINTISKPTSQIDAEHGQVKFFYEANGVYNLRYIPEVGYEGEDYMVAEYITMESGLPEPKYIHFYFNVTPSIIYTQTDYATTLVNTPVDVFPMDNDQASHGPLSIFSITYASNGDYSSLPPNGLTFTPDSNYVGKANINYVVKDTIGNSKSGTIVINVISPENVVQNGTIKIATTNKNPATLLLPLDGFTVDENATPSYGLLSNVGPNIIEYTSLLGASSTDTFGLMVGEYYRTVIVQTINIPEPNTTAIDDYVITTQGTAISFNVEDNDSKKGLIISDYSDDPNLVQDQDDVHIFTYTPPAGFSGEKVFSYTIFNGFTSETAKIHIWVNNFTPTNNATYYLSTPKNTPLVINYDVPISNFSFIESAPPNEGTMNIYDGLDTIDIGCDDISGYNMVVYEPINDFVGQDAFEISYCLTNGDCELVKVFVDVQDIGLDSICLCVNDCVWVGDADNDGKVNVADLLPMAYHQGEIGDDRDEANASLQWFGQHGDDWGKEQMYADKDIKHVDANGDGIVAGDDVLEIEKFYNKYHSLVGPSNLVIKDFPFELHTDQDTVYAGDHLYLTVSVGSEEHPVVNMNGLAYGLNIPPVLIDSSSLVVDFLDSEWFGANAASMEMAVQPVDGRIEAAFSRLSGLAVSGYGNVGVLDIIIEQDLIGISSDNEVIAVDINLEAIVASDGQGNQFTMPGFTKTIYVDLREDNSIFDAQKHIILYPNPAHDIINIHAEKGIEISQVSILNPSGALIKTHDINYTTARIDISELNPGVYISRIETNKGIAHKRFIVL